MVRTVLKIAGTALTAHGLSVYANIINTEDVAGLVVTLVGMWLSHQTHAGPLATGPVADQGAAGGAPAAAREARALPAMIPAPAALQPTTMIPPTNT